MNDTVNKLRSIIKWLDDWKKAIGILFAIIAGIGFVVHEYNKFKKIDAFIGDLKDVTIQKGNNEEIKKLRVHLEAITAELQESKIEVCESYLDAIRPTLDYYRNTYSSNRDKARQKERNLVICKNDLIKSRKQRTRCLDTDMDVDLVNDQIEGASHERGYWTHAFQSANEFQDKASKVSQNNDPSSACRLRADISSFLNKNRIK